MGCGCFVGGIFDGGCCFSLVGCPWAPSSVIACDSLRFIPLRPWVLVMLVPAVLRCGVTFVRFRLAACIVFYGAAFGKSEFCWVGVVLDVLVFFGCDFGVLVLIWLRGPVRVLLGRGLGPFGGWAAPWRGGKAGQRGVSNQYEQCVCVCVCVVLPEIFFLEGAKQIRVV